MVQTKGNRRTSVRPGLFMEKKMRSARRALDSSSFWRPASVASLMLFVRLCIKGAQTQHVHMEITAAVARL